MNVRALIKPVALGLLVLGQALASEPDFARESRLADEIVDVIFDGDPVWLEADGREFLGIYTEADDSTAAVIILHGRGFHPDWADTVNPLRVGLVERGYDTLSLQMPVLEKDARYYDYVPVFSLRTCPHRVGYPIFAGAGKTEDCFAGPQLWRTYGDGLDCRES